MAGPIIRTDIVEVYVFRREPGPKRVSFLQMHRAQGALTGTWQPVMGHALEGETAPATAIRETAEETGFVIGGPDSPVIAFWQLEPVNTYYLASHETVVMSPGFAVEISGGEPTLNPEHDAWRWTPRDRTDRAFFWPGQRHAVRHIVNDLLDPTSPLAEALRLPMG